MEIKVLTEEQANKLLQYDDEYGKDDNWTIIPPKEIPFDDPFHEPEDIVVAYIELAMDYKLLSQLPDQMDIEKGIYGFIIHRYILNPDMYDSGVIPIGSENSIIKDHPCLLIFPWALDSMKKL